MKKVIFILAKPDRTSTIIAVLIFIAACCLVGGCEDKNKKNDSLPIITDPGPRDIIGPIAPSTEILSILERIDLQNKIDASRTALVNLEKEKNAEIDRLKAKQEAELQRAAETQRAIDSITRYWALASIAALGIAILAGFVFGWMKSVPVFVVAGGTAIWAGVTGNPTVQTFAGIVGICLIVVVGVGAVVYMWINWRTSQQAKAMRKEREVKLAEGRFEEAQDLAAAASVLDHVATRNYDPRIVVPTSKKKRKVA